MYGGEQKADLTMRRYSNSNCAYNHITKMLTLEFIFMLNSRLVSWCSKHQIIMVLLLSDEVEYVALTLAFKKTT